ncbi:hypothetical protein [Pseudomonas sp. Kh13]|uniref:hypothetical protein n=1 Tax=Pseudomonas sp. Kh13 TaxID=2093744 RepID=UPI002114F4E4|nr:hypothetical protein [Pseudomonas sp. Kh13]
MAVLPFRQFRIGWTRQLRALKLFPDSQLSWKRYFYDNGSGHARAAVFTSYEEAMEAADEFNSRTSELVVQGVLDPVLQSSTTLKVEKALTAARRIQGEEKLMEREGDQAKRASAPSLHARVGTAQYDGELAPTASRGA